MVCQPSGDRNENAGIPLRKTAENGYNPFHIPIPSLPIKTLLLLAGRSVRFWPLSEKTLFPVCGKTILEHQIDRLRKGGCKDITLVGGAHNLEQAKALFPDLPAIEQEDLDLGMRGALLSALPSCGDGPVMVASGNDVIEPDGYASLVAHSMNADGALLAQKVSRYFPGGYLTVGGNNRITSIVEKPGEGKEPGDLVNIVAHVHNNAATLLSALCGADESRDDGYEQALQELFVSRIYTAVPYEGKWQAVKYPWDLLPLLHLLLSDIGEPSVHASANIHPTAVIDGPVTIGEGVNVLPHAVLRGPCTIGARSTIANNALVRSASIGENCVVGFGSEVKSSILSDHVWTHMSYIGDSVVGRNVSFGGGTVTANFRLDEGPVSSAVQEESVDTGLVKFGAIVGENCRLGIQVGMSPGVKIGSGTFVCSGVHVPEDIPDGKYARMKNGLFHVSDNRSAVPEPADRARWRREMEEGD